MDQFLEVAADAARDAGDLQRRRFRTALTVEEKAPDDIVTEVDTQAEAAIVDRITDAFPDHGILAEESGARDDSAYRWIVDPLDGTTNFAQGIPHYCVSIGLEVEGRLELGVVYYPPADDLYTAVRGDGASMNGAPISVSDVETFTRAVVAVEFSPRELARDDVLAAIRDVNRQARRTRQMGSSASELALLARGTFDGFFGTRLRPWDVAAGHVLVEEAGGTVTHGEGPKYSGQYIVSNDLVHDDLRDCVGP